MTAEVDQVVLVRLRPNTYWRSPITGQRLRGPRVLHVLDSNGVPSVPREVDSGSGVFPLPESLFRANESVLERVNPE